MDAWIPALGREGVLRFVDGTAWGPTIPSSTSYNCPKGMDTPLPFPYPSTPPLWRH